MRNCTSIQGYTVVTSIAVVLVDHMSHKLVPAGYTRDDTGFRA